jgi:hypothetical protein
LREANPHHKPSLLTNNKTALAAHLPGQLTIVGIPSVAKCLIVIDIQGTGSAMPLITRLSLAFIGLTSVLLGTSDGAETPKQTKTGSVNATRASKKPVHLVVRSSAEIKQTFTYSPYPAVPGELEGYAGSQVGGTGTYRLSVDPRGTVTQVTILKGFTVNASYDERFSNVKGSPVPALDNVMVQALMRWQAKPGPMRTVDIYWSFGTRPWVNYGKSNVSR